MTPEVFGAKGTPARDERCKGEDPGNSMRRSNTLLAAAALAALALSACDDRPSRSDDDREPVKVEQEAPAPVEQPPAPAPEVRDPTPTPPPSDRLPPEERSSEQSVQPESETLFY